jgi:hypothetical protein
MIKVFNEKRFLFSLCLIFFHISSFASSGINIALEKKLYDSYIWKALLHIREESPKINDKTFLLSYDDFSLKNELIKTIQNFNNGENICKYPARYLWLKEEIPNNNFKEFNCPNFENYIEKTNPEDIELIFASENVSSPSSMMGHVFFKIKSKVEDEKVKQNAVSFFTVIDTFNIPVLITKSTITGMKGYFILNPYQTQANKYLYEENRSIWEYKLNLTDLQKKLIYYHFWELKDIEMTYYFTGFNCATMIDDILSLTKKDYMNNSLWVTPKDVIKNANKNNLIENINMIPSVEWELNMLSENIDDNKIALILGIFKKKDFKDFESLSFSIDEKSKNLEKQFILAYSKYMFLNKNLINKNEYLYILEIINFDEKLFIDLKNYKNPLKTFDDSQLSLSYLDKNNKSFIGLSFLPASNTIFDDNREYFSENSLKIGEINLLIDSDKIHLDSLNLYDMKSLIPWNNITKEISKEFSIGYEKQYDKYLDEVNVLNVSGGAGITYKIHNDMSFYGLVKIGTGINFAKVYPYSSFETGVIVYEILNMKTVLSHEFIYNQDNSDSFYQNIELNQSLFINKITRIDININKKINENFENESLMFKFNYFF